MAVEIRHKVPVDTHQYFVDDFERLFVGKAAALDETRLDAQSTETLGDLGAPAMHEHRVDAQPLQPYDIVENGAFFANRAAYFDDNRLADELADIGQRFKQRLRFFVSAACCVLSAECSSLTFLPILLTATC